MKVYLTFACWSALSLPTSTLALTDADFYGQSPPVYPSRKSDETVSRNVSQLLTNLQHPGRGLEGGARLTPTL